MAAAISPVRPPASTEAPLLLDTTPPRPLGFRDQFALWGNLGVSLLGFGGSLLILAPGGLPRLSVLAALAAAALGTVIGTLMLAVSTVPGAETGAPAMVLLRGLFGTRLSYLPTALNIVQCLGWGTFELLVISTGIQALTRGQGPHWAYVVAAGVLTTALTIRPIGAVRLLRRYVTVLVGIALLWFSVALVRQGLPPLTTGSWQGFFPGMDTALAVAVSWVPLAADYSRHSRTPRVGFWGSFAGYTLTQTWTYALGIVALVHVADNPDEIFSAFLAVPLGAALFAILVLREVDQSFTNVYSTAMSVQNFLPRVDRRVLSVLIGALTTLLALSVDFAKYQNFLYLIGSVFVPLFAVLAVDYFAGGRRQWDLRPQSPSRPVMLVPWALGFVVYQLLNPGYVSWWAGIWTSLGALVHVSPQPWASASLGSFAVAAAATAVLRLVRPGRSAAG